MSQPPYTGQPYAPAAPPRKPFYKKPLFWVLVIGLPLLLFVGCTALVVGAGSQAVQEANEAIESAPAPSDPAAPPAEEPAPAEPAPGAVDGAEAVTVNSCETGDFGTLTANLTITNSDDQPRSFLVTISANGPDGNRVAELNAVANSIAAGQSASVDALGSATDAPAELACVVANVESY